MVLSLIPSIVRQTTFGRTPTLPNLQKVQMATSSRTGGVLPEPHRTSFGLVRVFLTVVSGLLIGAAISKHIANFLEENELFVPSDDDDDDD